MSSQIPIAWVASLLDCKIGKAQRLFKAQGGAIPLESVIEYVEKHYKNNRAKYNILVEAIEKIERRMADVK